MSTPQPAEVELRLVPDTPDSRLFIALVSCTRDREEAATSLEFVLRDSSDDSIDWVRQALLEHATFAYRRADDPQSELVSTFAVVTLDDGRPVPGVSGITVTTPSDFDATAHRSDYPTSFPAYWSRLTEE